MLKTFRLFIVLLMFAPIVSLSQATSSTAVVISPTYYFDATPAVANFTSHSLVSTTGEVFPSCAGSQTVCWFKFNIPTPANTTLGTKSIKIEIQGAAFSPVIDVFDASVVWKECIAGTVMKTDPTSNPIVPTNDYYIRISSTSPSAGSSFQIGVQYYPVAEVRPGYYPTLSTDPDGYSICDAFRRNNIVASGSSLVQASRFTFTPTTTPNSGSCSVLLNGTSPLILLSQLSCLCYNINYDVQVELQVDNHWCGGGTIRNIQMQAGPTTAITTANNSTIQFSSNISCSASCSNSTYEWEFTSQNGTVTTYQTTISNLPLYFVNCLRFNRIYQARVRIISCGVTGPWCGINGADGTPLTFFTPPMPTIPVPTGPIGTGPGPNNFCYTQVGQYSVVDVDFYQGIDTYIFQFVKVASSAPFTPIANPVIVFTGSSVCPITTGGCSPGNTYRVGIKPRVNAEACGAAQDGDYSPWCYFSVTPAPAPVPGMITAPEEEFIDFEVFEKNENLDPTGLSFQVIGNNQQRLLAVSTNSQEIVGNGFLKLYDINGRLVHEIDMYNATGVTVIQFELPSDLPTGIYIANVYSNNTSQTGKIFLSAN